MSRTHYRFVDDYAHTPLPPSMVREFYGYIVDSTSILLVCEPKELYYTTSEDQRYFRVYMTWKCAITDQFRYLDGKIHKYKTTPDILYTLASLIGIAIKQAKTLMEPHVLAIDPGHDVFL